MRYSEIWTIEHTFAWKSGPSRSHEVTIAVFGSEDLAHEWLRMEAAFAESNGWDATLDELESELRYETDYATNKFSLIEMPYYRKGSIYTEEDTDGATQ